jgi:hypothetical protein
MLAPGAVRATPAAAGRDPRIAVQLGGTNGSLPNTVPDNVTTVTESHVDSRLVFLARASARLSLVEAGEMAVEQAIDGLIEPFEELVGPLCACTNGICERWEREYRKAVVRPRDADLDQLRRLLDEDVTLAAASAKLWKDMSTPEVTLEAVKQAIRDRGLGALQEPATKERAQRCDANARARLDRWLSDFKQRNLR